MGNVILSLRPDTARELVATLEQVARETNAGFDQQLFEKIRNQVQPQLAREVWRNGGTEE